MNFEGIHDPVWYEEDPAPVIAHCELCGGIIDFNQLLPHLETEHPAEWATLERWPDGSPVVVNESLEPRDF